MSRQINDDSGARTTFRDPSARPRTDPGSVAHFRTLALHLLRGGVIGSGGQEHAEPLPVLTGECTVA